MPATRPILHDGKSVAGMARSYESAIRETPPLHSAAPGATFRRCPTSPP